jgi:glucose-6-phosphate isomerase, archaeal
LIDLSVLAGLPISMDPDTGELTFTDGAASEGRGERCIGELVDVLAIVDAAPERADETAYLLYRGVHLTDDDTLLTSLGLRYDLTVILPGAIGGELMKTAGHVHSAAPDGVGYPEIYDVIHGQAAFVLQFDEPLRVTIALCGPGERILIAPGASHLTVNIGPEPLVVADLVAIDSRNDYGEFRTRRGAAVHLMEDGDVWTERINVCYDATPVWHVLDGSRIGDFVPDQGPLYSDAIANPDNYAYLTAPAPRNPEMQALWATPVGQAPGVATGCIDQL